MGGNMNFRFSNHWRKTGPRAFLIKAERRLRTTIREMTPPNWGQSLTACAKELSRYLNGWVAHFRLCTEEATKALRAVDAHIRRRLRAIIIRQRKRPRFLFRSYVANFIILNRGLAAKAMTWMKAVMIRSAPLPTDRRQGLRKFSPDLISKARDGTTTQVTRILLAFVGTATFCLLSLSAPDSVILTGNSDKIALPFAGPVSFLGFLVLGPVILIVLWVFLQIYIKHSDRVDRIAERMPVARAPVLLPPRNPLDFH
jgi:Group II intron, maturase-specific domain